ncbi:MAG: aldo/keto reductase [Proteobacteria bacterium]|nr:aldo/keto reductase [Pseudomonadota bacterium]
MEYRSLGQSGLKVSLHTLGTMNFSGEGFFGMAGTLSVKEAARLVDIAVDHGVNFIDTANVYTTGKSEEAVGEVLKGRSDQLLVGTKVRFAMGKGPNEQGLSRFHIIRECEASLKRLKRDHIDVYYFHEWDGMTPVEESMEAVDTLVRQGKVRYIGCSNFSGWHIMKCLMAADHNNFQRFAVQQIHYTIEARDAEFELMPVSVDQGIGIQVWSPIAGGLLSGKFRRNAPPPQLSRHTAGWGEPPIRDENRLYNIIDALVKVGEGRGVSAAQVALAWLAGRPAVSSIIVGARTEAQLKDNLAAAALVLSTEERKLLDDVSLLPLQYPYWHQLNAASRLGPADLSLLAPHVAVMKPRM